ncbi:MAG: acyl-CoA dehydrogenase family protein [Planctomycetota bacterium]|jgi:acyl-CoA dehydrogenase
MPDVAAVGAFLAEHHSALAGAATIAAHTELAALPHAEDDAAARVQARDILAIFGTHGWAGYAIPEAFGGRGLDLRACCLVRESIAGVSPLADALFALQCLGSMPITIGGSEAQKQHWLPKVAAGEAIAAFAITEPDSGSDITQLRVTAVRDGDHWVLNGVKHFISNAGIADFYTVFAATDPAQGRKGLGAFIVPADTPGCIFAQAQIMSAPHPLGRMEFQDCRVPADAILGAPGDGFRLALETLDRLRATVAAAACGMAERALQEATRHALRRKQFGQALGDFQLIQQKLAVMATELTASRLLTYRAAAEKDHGADRVTVPAAMAKWYATDHPCDQLYRAVRALRIYEGTTEIQHIVIGRELLKGARLADAT